MGKVFLTSDQHFGHSATFERFKLPNGQPLRPFTSVDEMNDTLVNNWNSVVGPDDLVYNLGDVVINAKYLPQIGRCNGHKILIQGNHDPIGGKKGHKFNFEDYFETIVAYKELEGLILTHVPIHPDHNRWGVNVHGHLHGNQVMIQSVFHRNTQVPDPRYLCVSVEHTNFTPITLEEVRSRIDERQKVYG